MQAFLPGPAAHALSLPALQCGKPLGHDFSRLLLRHIWVGGRHIGCARLNHLLHRTLKGKRSAFKTIPAILPVFAAIGVGSIQFARISHGHTAALAEFLIPSVHILYLRHSDVF